MNNTKAVVIVKYALYSLLLLLFYVIQTVPGLFSIAGVRPIWVVPAAVVLAIFEGEFVGGVFGALAGLLCDMGSFTLFGFNGFLISLCCIAVGLLVIYLMRQNLLGCLLFVALTLLIRGSLDFLFSYGMWGYENAWKVYAFSILPTVAYSTAIAPIPYFLFRYLHLRFESSLKG